MWVLALLHGDLPGCFAGFTEVGDLVAISGAPLWDGVGGLGAVEINDQVVTGLQGLHDILGFDQGEGADRAEGVQGVVAVAKIAQLLAHRRLEADNAGGDLQAAE